VGRAGWKHCGKVTLEKVGNWCCERWSTDVIVAAA
jgi:hypothetical protein